MRSNILTQRCQQSSVSVAGPLEVSAMQGEERAHPWLGAMFATSAAVAYSTAGYFTRLLDLDVPTVLFWRGLYAGLFMSACIVLMHAERPS
jgi:hypothetical protein